MPPNDSRSTPPSERITPQDALAKAIEFFDQRDRNSQDYWEFGTTTRDGIASGLRELQAQVSETVAPQPKADPIADLCAHIKGSIRFCDHGYIHVTCGDCQRRN